MEELNEVVTIKKDDLEFLKECVRHFKEQSDMKDLEIEELKKQYEPQSLDLDLGDIDLTNLRETLCPKPSTEDEIEELVNEVNQY